MKRFCAVALMPVLYGALTDINVAAENNGYHRFKIQPLDNALVKRGTTDPGLKILFLGNAADMARAKKVDPLWLNLLPLRLVMVQKGDQVSMTRDDLEARKSRVNAPETRQLIEKWQRDPSAILQDFSGP